MKQLDKKFIGKGEVRGFSFMQLKANGYAYIYEVDTKNGKHWEVFECRQTQDTDVVISGIPIHFAAKVIYPTSNAFGIWAFCCTSLEKAEIRYKELTKIVEGKVID